MNNDTKPETTGAPTPTTTAPMTDSKDSNSKDAKFAAPPKALTEEDKKSLGDAKQASQEPQVSTR